MMSRDTSRLPTYPATRVIVMWLLAPVGCADSLASGREREHSAISSANLALTPQSPQATLPLRLSLDSAQTERLDRLDLVISPALEHEGGVVLSFTLREADVLLAEATVGDSELLDPVLEVDLGDDLPIASVFCVGVELVSDVGSVGGDLVATAIWSATEEVRAEFEFLSGPCT